MRVLTALLSSLLIALAGAACGSGDDGPGDGEVADASSFPAADGRDVEEIAAEATGEPLVLSPSGQVHRPGRARFGFGLFEVGGRSVDDADDLAVYLQPREGEEALGPFPARRESLLPEARFRSQTSYEDEKAFYIADVDWPEEGEYRIAGLVRRDGGMVAAEQLGPVLVGDPEGIPAVGDPAPSTSTPTVDDVADVSEIDTRRPPSTMHEEDLADVLGEKPVVLLFATPALCQTRVCGPVVDLAEQVKDARGGDGDVAFIHMEIFENNRVEDGLREPVRRYGLETEPWLFVIDADGTVSTSIEGAFSARELERAIEEVT